MNDVRLVEVETLPRRQLSGRPPNPNRGTEQPYLAVKSTMKILVICSLASDHLRRMLRGIERYQCEHPHWNVVLDSEGLFLDGFGNPRLPRWDGLIVEGHVPELFGWCQSDAIPVVDIRDDALIPGIPKVRPDNVAVGHLGAEHLLERGFKSLLFCGVDRLWSRERAAGFEEALQLAGHTSEHLEVAMPEPLARGWTARGKSELVARLRSLPTPLGVMACNDERANHVAEACAEAGLLIPHDVSIIGVDNDTDRCLFSSPPLSSVQTHREQIGYEAARLLDQILANPKQAVPRELLIEPGEILVRESSDCVAVKDEFVAAGMEYIHQHACKGVRVLELCAQIGVSRSQLERRFRAVINHSPQSYIRHVQLSRIKVLLRDTDLPLKHIADLTGFPHVEYLSVVFKRHTGITPGHYRQTNRRA